MIWGFLLVKSLVAARTSILVRLLNLKLEGDCLIRSTGLFGEGLIFSTVFLAMLVKNSLKLQAIFFGSDMIVPLIVKCERSCFFLLPLLIEEKSICHVLRKFF